MLADGILTIPALILLLATLVCFHELGHFIAAKLLKIRVEEFAFGFGPKLIRLFKRGDTEYAIHPIPLGGFVKLAGMEPGEENVPGGFNSRPVGSRMLVYLAGPTMSFVLAYLVFSLLGLTIGLPAGALNRVDLVMPGSRAERAGLKTGDVVVKINDRRIETGGEMVRIIHNSLDRPLVIVVNRGGRLLRIHATPGRGKIAGKTVGLLGFTPTPEFERVGLVESVKYGSSVTFNFLIGIIRTLVSREVKESVGGPLSIVDATLTSVRSGPHMFIQLIGILSLSLAVLNLLPIPILDGGQIVLLLGEKIKGKRLSPRTVELAQRIGLTVIAVIFVLIMYLDLSRIAANKLFR